MTPGSWTVTRPDPAPCRLTRYGRVNVPLLRFLVKFSRQPVSVDLSAVDLQSRDSLGSWIQTGTRLLRASQSSSNEGDA